MTKYLPHCKTMRELAWALNTHLDIGKAVFIAEYDFPREGTLQNLADNLMGIDRGCWTVRSDFDHRGLHFRRFDGWDELKRRMPCDLPPRAT